MPTVRTVVLQGAIGRKEASVGESAPSSLTHTLPHGARPRNRKEDGGQGENAMTFQHSYASCTTSVRSLQLIRQAQCQKMYDVPAYCWSCYGYISTDNGSLEQLAKTITTPWLRLKNQSFVTHGDTYRHEWSSNCSLGVSGK